MFKTIVIAALGFAAASAQFLDVRNLQNGTTTNTTAANTTSTAPAPVSFTAACSVTNNTETGCNTAGFCCAATTRTGANSTAPANLCVPTDFIGQVLAIGSTNFTFTRCLSATVAVTNRTACTNNTECGVSQCCTSVTLAAGTGSATRQFCTAGTAATLFSSSYTATSWAANTTARVSTAACTPNADTTDSFGAYIKASVMMVVAVLSVALF